MPVEDNSHSRQRDGDLRKDFMKRYKAEKKRRKNFVPCSTKLGIFLHGRPADVSGVPRSIAEHRLNIREECSPVRQKKRGQAPERNKAIQEEVEKLVDAGIMKEVHYHSWLSNPVMVKKHDGTWRMCVDFKDLNNACPKDCYPLPEIDWKVESLCGYPFKCFLDAYKGYHQIKMAKEDEEKQVITSQGIFCYSKMSFGLRMLASKYQRLVDKAFQKQIGRNLEVYVDDLVIKSRTEEEIIRDITETFKTLWQINMKLNPKKCTFGMQEGMFLGYKVSTNGLRACPDKADAVLSLPSPRCIKDCTKKSDFQWTKEAESAFKQIKKLIAELPTLTAPREHEELIMYLAAAKEAISAVLMTDREGKQIPVYFTGSESPYDHGQKPEENYRGGDFVYGRFVLCRRASGAGLILTNPEGAEFTYAMRVPGQRNLPGIKKAKLWGIDIAGPFPEGPGKVKFLIVAIDYLTKWIEVKAVATITGNQVNKFAWDNIICRFGLPGEIISDNGKQFRDNPFKDWYEKLRIRQCFASVKHPQANGLVERANRSLGEGIKARLDERSKDWIEELPHVLWAHRTMIKSSNGETHSMSDGTEARKGDEQARNSVAKAVNDGKVFINSSVRRHKFQAGRTWSSQQSKQGLARHEGEAWTQVGRTDKVTTSRLEQRSNTKLKDAKERKYQGHGNLLISKSVI
ncbi:reverse transcriptase domain-containing protein [Tanacetum coccineum]